MVAFEGADFDETQPLEAEKTENLSAGEQWPGECRIQLGDIDVQDGPRAFPYCRRM